MFFNALFYYKSLGKTALLIGGHCGISEKSVGEGYP